MTSILFLFGVTDKLQATYQFVLKKYQQQEPLVMWASQREALVPIDDKLWAADPSSFIAHSWADEPHSVHSPIILSHTDVMLPHHHWLVNLDHQWSPIYARFEKVLEIVDTSESDTSLAREKWKFYQSCGYSIQSHDMRKKVS